jgi:uncharacterized protein DUF6603
MTKSLTQSLLALLRDYLSPLALAAKNDQARAAFLGSLGHTATLSANAALLKVLTSAGNLSSQISSLDASQVDSFAGLQQLLSIGKQTDALIEGLQQLTAEPGLADVAATLAEEIAQLLLASWLRLHQHKLFALLGFFTIIKLRDFAELKPGLVKNGVTLRNEYLVDEFQFSRLSDLLSDPGNVLLQWYLPNGMVTGADAQLSADRLFPYLEFMADALGIPRERRQTGMPPPPLAGPIPDDDGTLDNRVDLDVFPPDPDVPAPPPAVVPDSYFSSYFPTLSLVPFANDSTQLKVDVRSSSVLHTGKLAGLLVGFTGDFNQTATLNNWKLTFSSKGAIPALLFSPSGIELQPGQGSLANGAAKLVLNYAPPSTTGPVFVLGSTTGTRLELGAVEVEAGIEWTGSSEVSAVVAASATSSSLVLSPGDGDGFLSSILPQGGLAAKFDFGISWSSNSGFAFNGGAGLNATLPVGLSLGGVLNIPSVYLGLNASTAGLQSELSTTISLSIGPIQAVVDRVGISSTIALPADGGAPHIGDSSFSFKPPSGVGLTIDSAGVSGGGFLSFDTAADQYSGVLQLKFNDVAMQAFGLITTKVAGGNGYSLLALIDADFPPVQLGWGFTLNGVGGLMAVNRTADVDALRAGLKADKLSTLLFRTNAITNAPQLLAQLDAFFPTAQGRFLFGPMALIGWGTPTILTVALAVILELPEPVRIILLARLAACLPSQSNALVRINMDALGVLDLSQDSLSLDATLFDSKIVGFTLSGDMALRANWSTNREFLLAIGGFHPQFTPPPGFPLLQRVVIDMPSGAISKMRLAAYLAITSNSLQFGANLDVFIGVSGFGLSGHLGFDALLQIDPFHFDADISGRVALTAGGDDLLSVGLDATLSGPAPWHIAGKFKVHIIFFDVHKSFSFTWGQNTPALQIPPVNVLSLLSTALADPRNWGTQLPAGTPTLVSLRSQDGSTLVVHPLAQIEVHESVVPLGLQITRFGSAAISGVSVFSITDFTISGTSVQRQAIPVMDDFAPAQFFDLSDTDKLSGSSFEQHNAGVRFVPGAPTCGPAAPPKVVSYETSFIDAPGANLRFDSSTTQNPLTVTDLTHTLSFGASAQADIRNAGKLRFQAPGKPVSITPQKFVIANTATLAFAGIGSASGLTYTGTKAYLTAAIAKTPSLSSQLQIVALHEMAAS